MSRRSALVTAAATLSALLAGCGTSTAGSPGSISAPPASATLTTRSAAPLPESSARSWSPPTNPAAGTPRCDRAALRLGYGPPMSARTGEHAVLYTLINHAAAACTLIGYPAITLYDASGSALPFRYTHDHSQYVTSAAPAIVTIKPNAVAYVLVAKYRCDTGSLHDVATIRITLPTRHPIDLTGPISIDRLGVSTLSYCRGGANDPGQTVAISPIEPTSAATTTDHG